MAVSQHRDEHLDLCAGYALGSLDDADRRVLEAHLREGCPTCAAELARFKSGAALWAATVPALRAPGQLRGRVLDAVRADAAADEEQGAARRAPAPRPARRAEDGRAPRYPWVTWGFAAAACLLAAFGVFEWQRAGERGRELASVREELTRMRDQLAEERRWADVPTAPRAIAVQLAPTPDGAPQLAARATYDPDSRRALVVFSNFAPPAGSDYQLWAILKTGPSSLGLIRADSTGHAVVRLADAGDPASLAAFAVSLEREGGAPTTTAPAGPVVMLGKLGG
jgi:anti-sigma-K factor RskA